MHVIEQIDFTKPANQIVIEASAGTGKTWTIERLFIKALLEANMPHDSRLAVTVQNILVVTFTNDAIHEIKERIYEQINTTIKQLIYLHNQVEHAQEPIKLDDEGAVDIFLAYLQQRNYQNKSNYMRDVQRLNNALHNFDNAAIFTIHGFCNKVLHDYPFICGVNTDFEVINNKSQLIHTLLINFMRSQIINNNEINGHIETVLANLNMLFNSNQFDVSLVERIAAKLPSDLFAINRDGYTLSYSYDGIASLDRLTKVELDAEEQRFAKAEFLAYVMQYLEQDYSALSNMQNYLSYDELILKLNIALIHSSTLADNLWNSFPVIFVDEFQDTDLHQWQIFSQIYHLGNYQHQHTCGGENISRGHVVIVGDPKQAIYHFRGADVASYVTARAAINHTVPLTVNFRSHPHITNFINQLFSLSNQGCDSHHSFLGDEINYIAVSARAKSTIALPTASDIHQIVAKSGVNSQFYSAEVQLVVINGATKPQRQAKLLDAIAFEIMSLLRTDTTLCGKIAILVNKNSEAKQIVEHLRQYNLPASEIKLGNIFATDTAHSLWLILDALSDLTNRKKFILAITANIFNLPDMPLTMLNNAFTDNGCSSTMLTQLQQAFYRYREIWQATGIIAFTYAFVSDLIKYKVPATTLTNRQLANIWQLSELLHKQSQQFTDCAELLIWFKERINHAENNLNVEVDANSEELIRLDNDDEQIIVTTQHKAKGLEYDIVFCPYFKTNIVLDGTYDFNYRRPFFAKYNQSGENVAELVMDKDIGTTIVDTDNQEAHRLNYVALTRAKSRLYIYLKQHTITRTTGKYNAHERPDKLATLFGYVRDNPQDVSHRLFDYPAFFTATPHMAIKQPDLFPGVVVYNRDNLQPEDLAKLSREFTRASIHNTLGAQLRYVREDFNCVSSFYRQSYTSLTRHEDAVHLLYGDVALDEIEILFDDTAIYQEPQDSYLAITSKFKPNTGNVYRYSILHDKRLQGATFGVLFHSLCEKYPVTPNVVAQMLSTYNIETSNNDYVEQLMQMLNEAFSYPILLGENNLVCLKDLTDVIYELDFNLNIKQQAYIARDIKQLIIKHMGESHPFSLATDSLGAIQPGFLVGFIDVMFMHQGKFWVLDYKTNTLDDYTGVMLSSDTNIEQEYRSVNIDTLNTAENNNSIMLSMAEHHYYLQYLLYLVAVKRYLENYFAIPDASHLLGGAIYYYVRGIYAHNPTQQNTCVPHSIFVDANCASLVRDIDHTISPK